MSFNSLDVKNKARCYHPKCSKPAKWITKQVGTKRVIEFCEDHRLDLIPGWTDPIRIR
jgi:hypothetical protein